MYIKRKTNFLVKPSLNCFFHLEPIQGFVMEDMSNVPPLTNHLLFIHCGTEVVLAFVVVLLLLCRSLVYLFIQILSDIKIIVSTTLFGIIWHGTYILLNTIYSKKE